MAKKAPKLIHQGTKQRSNNYWSYDPDVLEFIGNETGKAYSQFRLMLYLMGNAPGWGCSESNVLKRTGISNPGNLSKIKKALKERGWIDYKEGEYIKVLFDNIYDQMQQGCSENNVNKSQKEQVVLRINNGCSENKEKGCSENNHNNINNNINNSIQTTSSLDGGEQEKKEVVIIGGYEFE